MTSCLGLEILSTSFIDFLYNKLGELRTRSLVWVEEVLEAVWVFQRVCTCIHVSSAVYIIFWRQSGFFSVSIHTCI